MFLSGFVQDMAKIDSVPPEEVLVWILDERIGSLFPFYKHYNLHHSQYP